jgi:CDGSH-type Zn-finger protein
MSDVQVTFFENGPYQINGPIALLDPEGNPIEVPGEAAFLCRCGNSSNKPFCDGTHRKIGFQGAMPAAASEAG